MTSLVEKPERPDYIAPSIEEIVSFARVREEAMRHAIERGRVKVTLAGLALSLCERMHSIKRKRNIDRINFLKAVVGKEPLVHPSFQGRPERLSDSATWPEGEFGAALHRADRPIDQEGLRKILLSNLPGHVEY